jgi:hypothetical protein
MRRATSSIILTLLGLLVYLCENADGKSGRDVLTLVAFAARRTVISAMRRLSPTGEIANTARSTHNSPVVLLLPAPPTCRDCPLRLYPLPLMGCDTRLRIRISSCYLFGRAAFNAAHSIPERGVMKSTSHRLARGLA